MNSLSPAYVGSVNYAEEATAARSAVDVRRDARVVDMLDAWTPPLSRLLCGWRSWWRHCRWRPILGTGSRWSTRCGRRSLRCAFADLVGVDEEERIAAYYTSLLDSVYCHADAHEQTLCSVTTSR